jgi:hypothetical protein
MDMPDGEAAQELGSIAHGPVLLTPGGDVAVGLRCVFAHRTGLHLPIVLIARDVHADAAARRLREHGDELRVELGPADGATMVRLSAFATQGAGGADEYRQESSYWHPGLPSSSSLTLTVSWPAIGLPPASAVLHLPDLADLARAAIPLY